MVVGDLFPTKSLAVEVTVILPLPIPRCYSARMTLMPINTCQGVLLHGVFETQHLSCQVCRIPARRSNKVASIVVHTFENVNVHIGKATIGHRLPQRAVSPAMVRFGRLMPQVWYLERSFRRACESGLERRQLALRHSPSAYAPAETRSGDLEH